MSFRKRTEASVKLPPLSNQDASGQTVARPSLGVRPSFRTRLTNTFFKKDRKESHLSGPDFIVAPDDAMEEDWDMHTSKHRMGARHGMGISVKKLAPAPWEEKENMGVPAAAPTKRSLTTWGRKPSEASRMQYSVSKADKAQGKVVKDLQMVPLAYLDPTPPEKPTDLTEVSRQEPASVPKHRPLPEPPKPAYSPHLNLVPLSEARERLKSSAVSENNLHLSPKPFYNERAAHSTGELPMDTGLSAHWAGGQPLRNHNGAPLLDLKRLTMNLDALRLDLGLDHSSTPTTQPTVANASALSPARNRINIDRGAPGPLKPIQEFNRLSMAFKPIPGSRQSIQPKASLPLHSHGPLSSEMAAHPTDFPEIIVEFDEA